MDLHHRALHVAGQQQVDGLSFTNRAGEVLAVAGVQGNGQTELTEALLGLQDDVSGSVVLDGVELVGKSTRAILDSGVGFIPEDRQVDGLVPGFTIAENLMLNRSFKSPFTKFGSLRIGALREFAQRKLTEYDVRARDIDSLAANLSGGNQQKVVVARELSRDLRLLVAAQPTRGVDVGSIEFIHTQIVAARDSGVPVLVVSTELDEVVALADRGEPGPINLGNPHELAVLDLAQWVIDLTGSSSTITFVDRPVDDPSVRRPDTTLARERLGWSPEVTIEDGLLRTIA